MSAQQGDEYTPRTEDVRRDYRAPKAVFVPRLEGENLGAWLSRQSIESHLYEWLSQAAFDRWLAAHDREQFAAGVRAAREAVEHEKWRGQGIDYNAALDDALAAIDALHENGTENA